MVPGLAEPVIGPRFARTRWLARDDREKLAALAREPYIRAMTYVDAAVAPLRKTGQIKIHGPAAFEGMRKAGQLVARCLDMLVDEVKPGVPTDKLDKLVLEYA